MIISRRVFFASLLLAKSTQAAPLRVSVLETFDIGSGSRALLVHHADAAARDAFANWLQTHPKAAIRVRSASEERAASIFRIRMCFGRGLILLERPIQIREREVLTILTSPSV